MQQDSYKICELLVGSALSTLLVSTTTVRAVGGPCPGAAPAEVWGLWRAGVLQGHQPGATGWILSAFGRPTRLGLHKWRRRWPIGRLLALRI